MIAVVNDANILIDLIKLDLVDAFFKNKAYCSFSVLHPPNAGI
jgi:hypothetical protein